MSISLVVGLGNPGRDYADTRHNVGWRVVDALAARHRLGWERHGRFQLEAARWSPPWGGTCWLVKPQTFMNESGVAVRSFSSFHRIPPSDTVVVHDELAFDLGRIKVAVGGSAGGHNGIASLIAEIGEAFVRFRIGIGPRVPAEMDLKDFVLQNFTDAQLSLLSQSLASTLNSLTLLLEQGVAQAMNQINRKQPNEPDKA